MERDQGPASCHDHRVRVPARGEGADLCGGHGDVASVGVGPPRRGLGPETCGDRVGSGVDRAQEVVEDLGGVGGSVRVRALEVGGQDSLGEPVEALVEQVRSDLGFPWTGRAVQDDDLALVAVRLSVDGAQVVQLRPGSRLR